jgi:anthranilate phosphoribosyltransferase
VTLCGRTTVAAVEDEGVRTFTVTAEDAGLPMVADRASLRGGDAAANAAAANEILAGARGPRRDVVLLNAAAVLLVADRARDLREGVAQAADAIDSGRAASLLGRVREASSV